MRGVFVTGTDTGAGKTVLAAAIAAALASRGASVGAFKPVVTGLDEPDGEWPPDHELLAAASGGDAHSVAPLRFGPAVSPHLAAAMAGTAIDPAAVVGAARAAGAGVDALVVEGVGGLLVPIAPDWTVLDLAVELALPVVIAARPGLGTINHSLLTVAAARRAGLDVRAVVLTPWPAAPAEMHLSNRATIARLGEVAVELLPSVSPEVASLARAGAALPVDAWVGPAARRGEGAGADARTVDGQAPRGA